MPHGVTGNTQDSGSWIWGSNPCEANMKKDCTKIVKDVSKETMDGKTDLEKRLNAYLTCQFIGHHDLPADECLTEAREIVKMMIEHYAIAIFGEK